MKRIVLEAAVVKKILIEEVHHRKKLCKKCSGNPMARTIQSVTTSSNSVFMGEHAHEKPGLFTIPANISPMIAGGPPVAGK